MVRKSILFLLLLTATHIVVCQPIKYFQSSIAAWRIEAEPEVYAGDDLFFLIDGGADLYLEYGFKEVAVANYVTDNQKIRVEVYEMINIERAWGVFSARRPFPALTGSNHYMAIGDGYVMAVQGTNYFVVSAQQKGMKTDDLTLFLDDFQSSVNSDQQYSIHHKLLLLSDDQQQGVLFFGRAGFSSVYSFGSSNFQNFVTGVAQKLVSRQILIELQYHSPDSATVDLDRFKQAASDSERYTKNQDSEQQFLLHDRDKATIILRQTASSIFITISPL